MFEFDTIHYFEYYNTLDVDFDFIPDINLSCSKEKITNVFLKIINCKDCSGVVKEDSNKKGYHLRFYCKIQCDKCRLVFDDYIRFDADSKRKKEFTNIIFDTKKGY